MGQKITGTWFGLLNVQGRQLKLVFNITKTDVGYTSTMDSPDQNARGIAVTNTLVHDDSLKIAIPSINLRYEGIIKDSVIVGIFKQNELLVPMNLTRAEQKKKTVLRPQEPKPPFPYRSENVTFANSKAKIMLAGTLTLPKKDGAYPVVILITGSGAQNRDEEILGHKPFLLIADHLTRNGIAVLRCDDRGIGQSTGDFGTATTADFATDIESAIAYIKTRKEFNLQKIGLIGHSEGGIIAPLIASQSKDIDFIVLLAGTGERGDKILLKQVESVLRTAGKSELEIRETIKIEKGALDIVLRSKNIQLAKPEIVHYLENQQKKYPEIITDLFGKVITAQLTNTWMYYFIRYDPIPALERVKCAVLAVGGEKDTQVPSKENLEAIKRALEKGKNKHVTIIEQPGLNHLFQECQTGSMDEYGNIEQTFSPKVLDKITKWILLQVQK